MEYFIYTLCQQHVNHHSYAHMDALFESNIYSSMWWKTLACAWAWHWSEKYWNWHTRAVGGKKSGSGRVNRKRQIFENFFTMNLQLFGVLYSQEPKVVHFATFSVKWPLPQDLYAKCDFLLNDIWLEKSKNLPLSPSEGIHKFDVRCLVDAHIEFPIILLYQMKLHASIFHIVEWNEKNGKCSNFDTQTSDLLRKVKCYFYCYVSHSAQTIFQRHGNFWKKIFSRHNIL